MITSQVNRIFLYVEKSSEYDFSGCFLTPLQEMALRFDSFSEFVMKLERQFDDLQFPQQTNETRKFSMKKESMQQPETKSEVVLYRHEAQNDRKFFKSRFLIHVLYRQHSSWQGKVIWLDKNREQEFRSVLELFHLLNEALSSSVESEQ